MKIVLCLAVCVVAAMAETCNRSADCKETMCHTEHGWFLQCKNRACVCSHLSYVGKNCTSGLSSECTTLHGDKCTHMNLHWRCLDNSCHCTRI